MALQFNTQDMGSFDAGTSREPMPDTYVPPRRESNAGSGFFQLAKALDGLQANNEKEQAKRDQMYEAQGYVYVDKVLQAIAANGGKPLPSEKMNEMFPSDMGALLRSHLLSNAGYIAGHSEGGSVFAGVEPTLDPAADMASYNDLISKKFEGYGPEVDPFFVSGMKKAYYSALTQRMNADASARVTEAQDANAQGVGARALDILKRHVGEYNNQASGVTPADPLPLPPKEYVPGPGSDASGSTGYRFGVIDQQGNRNPANFTALTSKAQSSANLLANAMGRDLIITPSGGTQPDKRSSTSQHHVQEGEDGGKAIDVYIGNMSDAEKSRLVATAISLGYKGIGAYSAGDGVNTLHLDVRDTQGNGPNGLALWHRLQPNVDSAWTTGPKWYQDGVKMGLNGEVPNVRLASADPTVATDASVDGQPTHVVTPPAPPIDHVIDDRGMETPTIRIADNSTTPVPSPYGEDAIKNRMIYNIRAELTQLAKEARTGAVGRHGALKSQKAIVQSAIFMAHQTGDADILNALPWDAIPPDMLDDVTTARGKIADTASKVIKANDDIDKKAQGDVLAAAKEGLYSGKLTVEDIKTLEYKDHKGEIKRFADPTLVRDAMALANGELVSNGQSFENARQFKSTLKPIIMSGGDMKDAFINDERMKALTNNFSVPIDSDILKSWVVNAPSNLAMKNEDRTKLFKELDDMFNYGSKITSHPEFKTGFDNNVSVALADAVKASPLGKATLQGGPPDAFGSMSDEQRKGWTNLNKDVRTAYNDAVYRLTMEYSRNNNFADIDNLPFLEEKRIIEQASTYANDYLVKRVAALSAKDSELYGNKVTSTNSGTVFNFKVDRADDPMFGQQVNNAVVVGKGPDGTYMVKGYDAQGNLRQFVGVKPYEMDAVQYLFHGKDGTPTNFDQFNDKQYADGRDVLKAAKDSASKQAANAPPTVPPADMPNLDSTADVQAELKRVNEDRTAKEQAANAATMADIQKSTDAVRKSEADQSKALLQAQERVSIIDRLKLTDEHMRALVQLRDQYRRQGLQNYITEVQRRIDDYLDEYIKKNPQ